MKAKELAEKLLENPDFDVRFFEITPCGADSLRTHKFKNVTINDIGYSERVICLGGDDDND